MNENKAKIGIKSITFYLLAYIAKVFYLLYHDSFVAKAVVVNPGHHPHKSPTDFNVIYTFWHSKTLLILPHCRNRGIVVLTLTDLKNYFYDKLCACFGYRTVPVASESGATLKLKEMLENGFSVALAVDGPRGPLGSIRPGAVYLSRKTKKPIVAIGIRAEKSFRLKKRWDRYEIPIPFSRTFFTVSDPIRPDGKSAEEMTDELRKGLGDY